MARKKTEDPEISLSEVRIKPPEFKVIEVEIRGISPLITHRFSEKAKEEMRAKQGRKLRGIVRPPKDPQAEFEAAKHADPASGAEGITCSAFKGALMTAAGYYRTIPVTQLKGCIFVLPDFQDQDGEDCVRIEGKAQMREDTVRLAGPSAVTDLRYRPMYWPWSAVLRIQFDASMVSVDVILALLVRAGFSVGVGEWRPSSPRSKTGWCGRWQVIPRQ